MPSKKLNILMLFCITTLFTILNVKHREMDCQSYSFVTVVFNEQVDEETIHRSEVIGAVIKYGREDIKVVCLQPGMVWNISDRLTNSFMFKSVSIDGREIADASAEVFHQCKARNQSNYANYLQYWLITLPINEHTIKLKSLEWYPKSSSDSMLIDRFTILDGKLSPADDYNIGSCLIKDGKLVGFETREADQKMLCNARDALHTDLF
jgi:hypothetical protein